MAACAVALVVEVGLGGAAFLDDPIGEAGRVIGRALRRLEVSVALGDLAEPAVIVDANGNTCGSARLEVRCRRCLRPIVAVAGHGWLDAGSASSAGLVFCFDQDETHDGLRHDPEWRDGGVSDLGEALDPYVDGG